MIRSTYVKKSVSPEKVHRWIFLILIAIMTLRISSYFTLFPDSIGMTRTVKIGLRFLLTGFSFIVFYYLKKQHSNFSFSYKNPLSGIFYMLYVLLSVASILWSTNVFFTILQLMMLFESIVFVWIFYHVLVIGESVTEGKASFVRILGISITIISIIFLLGIYVDPDNFYRLTHGGTIARLGGYIINPNELGMLAVIGITMIYIRLYEGGPKITNSIAFSSLIAFFLVSLIFVLMSKSIWLKLGTVVSGIIVLPIVFQKIIVKEGNVEEVMSLTGRLPFWSDLLTYGFPNRPLLGYGYMSISESPFTKDFDSIHAYAGSMTHNTFVQVLINLGLIGAFIVLIQMFLTFRSITISQDVKLKLAGATMMIPLIINSMTEFGIFGEINYGIYFYHLVILMFIVKKSEEQKDFTLVKKEDRNFKQSKAIVSD